MRLLVLPAASLPLLEWIRCPLIMMQTNGQVSDIFLAPLSWLFHFLLKLRAWYMLLKEKILRLDPLHLFQSPLSSAGGTPILQPSLHHSQKLRLKKLRSLYVNQMGRGPTSQWLMLGGLTTGWVVFFPSLNMRKSSFFTVGRTRPRVVQLSCPNFSQRSSCFLWKIQEYREGDFLLPEF